MWRMEWEFGESESEYGVSGKEWGESGVVMRKSRGGNAENRGGNARKVIEIETSKWKLIKFIDKTKLEWS